MRVSASPSVHANAKKSIQTAVMFVVAALVVLAGFAGPARAQIATGTINGTVTDPKGLAIEGASVGVKNTDTGIDHPVMTNETGRYVVPLLQPGHFEVTVMKDGFATVLNKDITLIVGQTLTIDVQLPLATQQGTITVTAATPLIETEKTEQSQALNENLVNGLPLGGRRWEDFVLLTPGVTNDGGSGLQSFHGISGLYNNNTVDGANNNQAFFSESRGRAIIVSYVYSQDSIKEFQVSSSNFSAEFGQAAGGTVNAVTKSGTNQLHGDLFYDLRYPTLNALDPVGNASGIKTQSVHQQNHFGGSVGAPIIKDKLFFFTTYDGFRKVNPIAYTSSTNAATFAGFACPAAVTAAQCTAAKSFVTTDLLGAFARNLKQDVAFAKLDYQLNQANHLSAAFNWANWGEPYGYNTSPSVSNGGATQNGSGGTHNRFLIVNWNTTISSDKLNEARFQWGRDFEFDGTNSPGPAVSLSSIASYGETSALPRPAFPDEHRYQASDSFTWIHGAHTVKMGVDVNFIHELLINLFTGDGGYSYSSGTTAQIFSNWVADVYGANLGDGLTGEHWTSFSQVTDPITGVGKDDFYNNDYAGFVQDTWKARPNLTVNIGLRYDIQDVPRPPKPNTLFPIFTQYTSTLNIDKNNFAPRIGFAWSPNSKTVFRAGYGIFYAKTSNSTYYALRVENGVYQQLISCTSPGSCPQLTFPNVLFTPPGPAVAAPFAGALTPTVVNPNGLAPGTICGGMSSTTPPVNYVQNCEIHGMAPDFVNPAVHELNVTFERQLPGNMSLTASYLLTRGLHLPTVYDANLAPTNQTATYNILPTVGSAFKWTVPYYVCNPTNSVAPCATGRLNSATGPVLDTASVLNSWYNGMVLTLRKPVSHGIEVLANYTLSRAMDNGETSGTNGTFYGSDGVLDPYNLRGDYAHSDLDQRNRFVGTFIWAPPFAHGIANPIERQFLDGWSFSGIVTAVNGQPYTATLRSSSSPFVTGVGGGVDGGLTGGAVSPFSGNSASRIPWLPRNSYNYPGFAVMDFRVQKDIVFKECYHFQIRGDAFNLFNSPIVTGVNQSPYTYGTSATCPAGTFPCLLPVTSPVFQAPTITNTILGGPRQLQIGGRFEF